MNDFAVRILASATLIRYYMPLNFMNVKVLNELNTGIVVIYILTILHLCHLLIILLLVLHHQIVTSIVQWGECEVVGQRISTWVAFLRRRVSCFCNRRSLNILGFCSRVRVRWSNRLMCWRENQQLKANNYNPHLRSLSGFHSFLLKEASWGASAPD